MIDDQDRLLIFERFVVDRSLPKFQRVQRSGRTSKGVENVEDGDDEMMADDMVRMPRPIQLVDVGDATQIRLVPYRRPGSFLSRLAFWRREPEADPGVPVEEFFRNVKNSVSELEIVAPRAAGYERAIENARRSGQHALVEQLLGGLNAYRMETQLVAVGLTKFLSEEVVVRFYKASKRGLRLDWIRNFARPIPEAIIALKSRADELGLFDNYAVLHYDPNAKAFAETEQEKARKRDPILFGLMKNRRVLYVVGDWIDETCDLTLDQFADQVGTLQSTGAPYR